MKKSTLRLDSHKDVIKAILEMIKWRQDIYAWKNNTGALPIGDTKRYISFGHPGSADILGLTSDGRFIGIEVKVGEDRQSQKQKDFEEYVNKFRGRYLLTSSTKEVQSYLDTLELPRVCVSAFR